MTWGGSLQRNYLFSEHEISSLLKGQEKAVRNEVASFGGNQLLNTSVDDLCEYFVKKYRLHPPVLLEDEAVADQQEKQIDVSQNPNRIIRDPSRPLYVTGTRVTLEIPFEGDTGLFKTRASTYTFAPPIADVQDKILILSVFGTNLTPEDTKSQFDRTLREIREHLSWIENDVKPFNEQLYSVAKGAIETRRQKLLSNQNLVASLGFPLKRRDDAPTTYAAPEVRRKAIPELPKASSTPFQPEPELDMENYEHILKVCSNMVQVMERSPSAFPDMKEEELRTHFLVQLNGQYEGNATGETFNYNGKTDILIRVQDRNIFIAECKFWSGQKGLLEAIDQLLGYTNWRDTKTAILLFNRNQNFSRILQEIPGTVESHPKFKRRRAYKSETGFRFTLGHQDDENRELLLTIFAFDVSK